MAAILGTRWHARAIGGGTFHCPRCDHERDYTGTALRPVLTAFGAALFPVGAEQTLVACDGCSAVYDVSITTMDPERARAVRAEDELALEAVLGAVMFSDSRLRPVEREAAEEAVRHYAHRGKAEPEDALTGGWKARRRAADSFDRVARLCPVLSVAARRRILAAAYRVCAADRELHPQEARLIMRLGETLELHPRQVREAMKEGRS